MILEFAALVSLRVIWGGGLHTNCCAGSPHTPLGTRSVPFPASMGATCWRLPSRGCVLGCVVAGGGDRDILLSPSLSLWRGVGRACGAAHEICFRLHIHNLPDHGDIYTTKGQYKANVCASMHKKEEEEEALSVRCQCRTKKKKKNKKITLRCIAIGACVVQFLH